ncbi:hypothetical protein EDB84DRAFT_1446436 [Lactarius hengduanensis]|nr:hypothetical protein EDB84DRAFT_1446436 [Lactarius hengduanensis]
MLEFAGYSGEYPGPQDPEIFMEEFCIDGEDATFTVMQVAATMTLANPASKGTSIPNSTSHGGLRAQLSVGIWGERMQPIRTAWRSTSASSSRARWRHDESLDLFGGGGLLGLLSIPGLQTNAVPTFFENLGDNPDGRDSSDVAAQALDSVILRAIRKAVEAIISSTYFRMATSCLVARLYGDGLVASQLEPVL